MVKDDVQYHVHARGVGRRYQIDQVLTGSKARIDFEKVLNPIAVVGVEPAPLLEDRAEPDGGRAHVLQV